MSSDGGAIAVSVPRWQPSTTIDKMWAETAYSIPPLIVMLKIISMFEGRYGLST